MKSDNRYFIIIFLVLTTLSPLSAQSFGALTKAYKDIGAVTRYRYELVSQSEISPYQSEEELYSYLYRENQPYYIGEYVPKHSLLFGFRPWRLMYINTTVEYFPLNIKNKLEDFANKYNFIEEIKFNPLRWLFLTTEYRYSPYKVYFSGTPATHSFNNSINLKPNRSVDLFSEYDFGKWIGEDISVLRHRTFNNKGIIRVNPVVLDLRYNSSMYPGYTSSIFNYYNHSQLLSLDAKIDASKSLSSKINYTRRTYARQYTNEYAEIGGGLYQIASSSYKTVSDTLTLNVKSTKGNFSPDIGLKVQNNFYEPFYSKNQTGLNDNGAIKYYSKNKWVYEINSKVQWNILPNLSTDLYYKFLPNVTTWRQEPYPYERIELGGGCTYKISTTSYIKLSYKSKTLNYAQDNPYYTYTWNQTLEERTYNENRRVDAESRKYNESQVQVEVFIK